MEVTAKVITGIVAGVAVAQRQTGRIKAAGIPLDVKAFASVTDKSGIFTPIRVTPVEPQWMTPYGIDYTIITNLDWQII